MIARRGPTRAKSYYEDDLVVCVLRGGFMSNVQGLVAVSTSLATITSSKGNCLERVVRAAARTGVAVC